MKFLASCKRIIALTSLCLLLSATSACAESEILSDDIADKKMIVNSNGDIEKIVEDDKGIISIAMENDLFAGRDLGYTNGLRLSYITSEEQMPGMIRRASDVLPLLNRKGKKRISMALGQNMYTPSDITKNEFIKNDFLYAGWTYGSLGLVSDSGKTYDNVVITFGVVGPSARAEQTQKYVHHLTGSPQPQGWEHQLEDEICINFSYERKWREIFEARPFGLGMDVLPHLGTEVGTVSTNISSGATFRLGYDLASDYGPPRIRPTLPGSDFFIPTKKIGGYLFMVAELRAVAHNIFLDGNNFKDSPGLEKNALVRSLQLGATITHRDVRISYTHVFVSEEFEGQQNAGSQFGAMTLSFRF